MQQYIKDIRKKYKLSRKKLAIIAGVSHRAVEKWEQGLRNPSRASLKLINGFVEKTAASEKSW